MNNNYKTRQCEADESIVNGVNNAIMHIIYVEICEAQGRGDAILQNDKNRPEPSQSVTGKIIHERVKQAGVNERRKKERR